MHIRHLAWVVGVSSAMALSADASAAIHLDFGATGQRVQTGYFGVSGSSSTNVTSVTVPAAALPDGETVVITSSTNQLIYRDRGNFSSAAAGDVAPLLEDYLRVGTGATTGGYATMTISIGNLLPSTTYSVTFRLYEGGANNSISNLWGPYEYTITGTGDVNPGSNTFITEVDSSSAPSASAAEQAGYTEQFISSASGTLTLTLTQNSGLERSVMLNSLDVVVPEPATIGLAAFASLGLLARRRKTA